MMAEGFADVMERFVGLDNRVGGLETYVRDEFNRLNTRVDSLDKRMAQMDDRISALESQVVILTEELRAHIKLHDKQYAEQERKILLIVKYLQMVIEKAKIPIDTKELEQLST